jgi:hypothetical protein
MEINLIKSIVYKSFYFDDSKVRKGSLFKADAISR